MLVVGMHRSGTSAVTGVLADLGLDPGADQLMRATADNPAGHFEIDRLTGFDDELLDALGGRWAAPPAASPDEVAALAAGDLGAQATDLIAEVFTESPWVWKDPRVALLLPFWRALLRPEPAAVLVVRHPLEVARSLQARNGMALDYGLALWERYARTALRDLEGMRVLVIDYGEAMDDPDRAVDGLARFVADAELLEVPPRPAGASPLVGDHHRQRVTDEEFGAEAAVTDEVRSLRRTLLDLRGHHPEFPAVDPGPETPGLQRGFTEHKRLSGFEEQVAALDAELALLESRNDDLRAEIDRRSAQASELASETMALREEQASLAARLIELETWWPVLTALRGRRVLRRVTGRG